MIIAANLRVSFGRTRALDGIDLSLDEGIHGLFGPNGSGKSTLLKVFAGLLRPTSGEVTVDGHVPRSRAESVRRMIGYAGHDSGLYPDLTVAENLVLFARLYGMDPARVRNLIESVGLAEWAEAPAGALSAGLTRRAAVARAILHEPKVLLLDEPYANLDDDAAEMVSETVKSWRAPGRVGVIATHGAKLVKRFADGGVILKRGRIVISGSYGEHRVEERAR
ncbi:MAG: heme ABC exporter ATP-binding protein CcmA [Actinomycetota bacterium]